MLKKLIVEQFVIIDRLDLDFKDGLTIFTGETGAGKSIILGAMGLILGDEPKPQSIRTGATESTFEAHFTPPKDHPVWNMLIQKQLASTADETFTIHRTMRKDGDDTIKLNTNNIDLELLKEIGALLVEIHGQTANHTLLGPDNQLNLLDLSGNFPPEVFENVASALRDVVSYKKQLDEEKLFLAQHKGLKLKKIEDTVKKFESVGMKEGFIEEVTAEHKMLATAKNTMETFQSILGRLIASDGAVMALTGSKNSLENEPNLDSEKIQQLKQYLDNAVTNTRAAVTEIGELLPEYEIDINPLNELNKILKVLKEIAAEEKLTLDQLTDFYIEQSTKVKRVYNGREKLAELDKALNDAKNNYKQHASVLTEKRIEAGAALGKAITAEFEPLKLGKAEFIVEVEEDLKKPWTKLGFNNVTFKARMNPGMPFSPISETASGGELARMILALKVIMQRVQVTSTLVFDEVDTGIGGAAAAAVGDRIALLSAGTQVLVITHSPQVASRGNQHLYISKKVEGEITTSRVRELSMEERINEISRMLAGDQVTEASNAAAEKLIEEAQEIIQARNNTPEPPQQQVASE